MPHDVRVLYPCWFVTTEKSRLTVADKKSYGSIADITHCPTPSPVVNAAMEIKATLKNYPMLNFDVVSAFPHAAEDNEFVFMVPPREWVEADPENRAGVLWRMLKALYGRRTAGARFRDFFEAVLTQLQFVRGNSEPCLFVRRDWDVVLTHHVDDGRLVGPSARIQETVEHMQRFMLLKVTPLVMAGMGFEHLGRTKIRTVEGWRTIPDAWHEESIISLVLERTSGKAVTTPAVRRGTRTDFDILEVDEKRAIRYRSAVGSMIFLAQDRE